MPTTILLIYSVVLLEVMLAVYLEVSQGEMPEVMSEVSSED